MEVGPSPDYSLPEYYQIDPTGRDYVRIRPNYTVPLPDVPVTLYNYKCEETVCQSLYISTISDLILYTLYYTLHDAHKLE